MGGGGGAKGHDDGGEVKVGGGRRRTQTNTYILTGDKLRADACTQENRSRVSDRPDPNKTRIHHVHSSEYSSSHPLVSPLLFFLSILPSSISTLLL